MYVWVCAHVCMAHKSGGIRCSLLNLGPVLSSLGWKPASPRFSCFCNYSPLSPELGPQLYVGHLAVMCVLQSKLWFHDCATSTPNCWPISLALFTYCRHRASCRPSWLQLSMEPNMVFNSSSSFLRLWSEETIDYVISGIYFPTIHLNLVTIHNCN